MKYMAYSDPLTLWRYAMSMMFPEDSDRESHPCEKSSCDSIVPYDDEPYCFDHSPDSGSNVPGYSYKQKHAKP